MWLFGREGDRTASELQGSVIRHGAVRPRGPTWHGRLRVPPRPQSKTPEALPTTPTQQAR